MKSLKFLSIIMAFIVVIANNSPLPAYAADTKDIFNEDAMNYFSAEILCYSLQGRNDIQNLLGKSVKELVETYHFGGDDLGNYATNGFGKLKTNDLYKRYLYGMRLTAVYDDENSGFYACVFESMEGNSSIFAVSASGPIDFSHASSDSYARLQKDISEIIRASDDEMNATLNDFSQDMSETFGEDWGANDFPLYFRNMCGSQPEVACKYFEEYSQGAGAGREITATGHSLGAGLAILLSTKYDIPAVTFDSVPMLDVTYYRDVPGMSANFHGYDRWKYVDYINECDLLAGRWEKQYKNYAVCDNRGKDVKSPASLSDIWPDNKDKLSLLVQTGTYDAFAKKFNKTLDMSYTLLCAHDIMTILAYDDAKDTFYLTAYDQHRVADRKSFVKDMGDQILEDAKTHEGREKETLINTISTALTLFSEIPNRTLRGSYLILGTSGDDSLEGKALANASDVIYGGDGNDTIHAHAGDDTLCGGNGDDTLFGEKGNDVYVYNKGDGTDQISESGGNNILKIYGYGEGDKLTVDYQASPDVNIRMNGETIITLKNILTKTSVGFTIENYCCGDKPETTVVDANAGNSGAGTMNVNNRASWIYLITAYFERLFGMISEAF